jgi:hypothetical protein
MAAVGAKGASDLLDFNRFPFWSMLHSKIALHRSREYVVEALGAGSRKAIRSHIDWGLDADCREGH